jgi:hypothetical protein
MAGVARVPEMSDEQILMQYLVVNRSSSQAAALGEAAVAALKASGNAIIPFPQETVSPCHCEPRTPFGDGVIDGINRADPSLRGGHEPDAAIH